MREHYPSWGTQSFIDHARPLVKICGLTRLEDVLAARGLGVWALGFVFAASPRRVAPETARELLEKAGLGRANETGPAGSGGSGPPSDSRDDPQPPLSVGVFVDLGAEEIAQVVRQVGLDGVQLHGSDGATGDEMRAVLKNEERPALIIRAVPVDSQANDSSEFLEAALRARGEADVVLLDTRVRGRPRGRSSQSQSHFRGASEAARFGGTGEVFPWRLARAVGDDTPLLVAGGIDPSNAREALAESGAWGVDVSSGVESSPGVKDARLMEELVASVKEESVA